MIFMPGAVFAWLAAVTAEAMRVADSGAVAVSNQGGIEPARPCALRVMTIMSDRGYADHNATDFRFRLGACPSNRIFLDEAQAS